MSYKGEGFAVDRLRVKNQRNQLIVKAVGDLSNLPLAITFICPFPDFRSALIASPAIAPPPSALVAPLVL